MERNGEEYEAQISENAGVADETNGLFKIKARLTAGADSLITGTNVKITLATQKAENVLTIPVDSVYYENQQAYVYRMESGKAVKTEIETGITNNENVEVKSGLTRDSQVITTWASQLKDGSSVKVKEGESGAAGSGTDTDGAADDAEAEMSDTQRLNEYIEARATQQNAAQ